MVRLERARARAHVTLYVQLWHSKVIEKMVGPLTLLIREATYSGSMNKRVFS